MKYSRDEEAGQERHASMVAVEVGSCENTGIGTPKMGLVSFVPLTKRHANWVLGPLSFGPDLSFPPKRLLPVMMGVLQHYRHEQMSFQVSLLLHLR